MTHRRPLTIVPVLALLAVPAAAQVYPERVPSARTVRAAHAWTDRSAAQERETQTARDRRVVRMSANGELDIANVSGEIVVTRGTGAEATIEIVKTARAGTAAEAQEWLKAVQVEVNERGPRVEVRTRYPNDETWPRRRRGANVSVDYTIAAPDGVRVTVRSVSGTVTVRDVRGDVTAESVSGDVVVENAPRVTAAKTISGSVRIANAEVENGLEASSVSGDVIVRKARAPRLTLSTVSGGVTAEDIDSSKVDLQAVSGDVRFSGRLTAGGRYDLTSHSGDIRFAVSGDTGFEVNATSFSGSVRSDLPLKLSSDGQERRGRQRALRGVYGNGSAVLDLTTFSGGIVIARQ